ncbi:MAG: glycosyltransferase family protein, partial [Desulfatiglandales bacterium]|nr:glycosyltransferase family protein [Desulfatiglandales bacterium]
MKTVGIIQARMSSTRLPGKALLEAVGKPLILLMLERVSRCKRIDRLWLATSKEKADDPLSGCVEKAGYKVFRGSLENVLSRYWHIGEMEKAGAIVRLTGDCPLHDPEVIDLVIDHFLKNRKNVDYVSNVLPPTYPDGLDTEVFTFSVLDLAHKNATSQFDLEHVVPYIRRSVQESGRQSNFVGPSDFSHLRWTL